MVCGQTFVGDLACLVARLCVCGVAAGQQLNTCTVLVDIRTVTSKYILLVESTRDRELLQMVLESYFTHTSAGSCR